MHVFRLNVALVWKGTRMLTQKLLLLKPGVVAPLTTIGNVHFEQMVGLEKKVEDVREIAQQHNRVGVRINKKEDKEKNINYTRNSSILRRHFTKARASVGTEGHCNTPR